MKEQYIENFGQVVKGHSTGTVYVLVPHKHRTTSCRHNVVIKSKRKTVKIYAVVDGEMREFNRLDGQAHEFRNYRQARKMVDMIENDRSTWSPDRKVKHYFKEREVA